MEELADILGEELALPRIEPRGKKNIVTEKDKYTSIRSVGPEIAAALQAHLQAGPQAADRRPAPTTRSTRSSCRSARTSSTAAGRKCRSRTRWPCVIYMMDVSGSMTDEQKEIVRIESFWIDTWIKKHYKGVETVYIIHDAVAQEVDEHTFYHTRESGGTKISSRLRPVQQDHRRPLSRRASGTSTRSTSPTATTGATTCPKCVELLTRARCCRS